MAAFKAAFKGSDPLNLPLEPLLNIVEPLERLERPFKGSDPLNTPFRSRDLTP
jgi:hypothetical protein